MYKNSFLHSLSEAHFSRVQPTRVRAPHLLAWSPEAAELIGFQPTQEVIDALAGNSLLPGMEPIATRYGGHQFGNWAGQLGDGRAILLGEVNGYEIQIKGAGPTPYSRRGDGRAVLRSSLREYLCSEAMFHLGVPTTRALALVSTGESVIRDMFYDGNPEAEPGAICTRLAPSFLRFGHFEIHASQGDDKELQRLVDYALDFYPGHNLESFFAELCQRTARLMVEWQRVGFVHGVMNTDNMSVLGLTIDYGPYGWLDVYDPDWTPNTTDRDHRRYRFGQQPAVALWNLTRLAEAFTVLGTDVSAALAEYESTFIDGMQRMLTRKLGFAAFDISLISRAEDLLRLQETDMTIFYRELADLIEDGEISNGAFYTELTPDHREQWKSWLKDWREAVTASGRPASEIRAQMNRVNPAFIVRNYLAQEAVDALAQGDDGKLKQLEKALRNPYEVIDPSLCVKRPEWARNKPGCSSLSCSS